MTNRILAEIDAEIARLTQARALLSNVQSSSAIEHSNGSVRVKPAKGKKHRMSAEGRERIAAAARKRWAAYKKQKKAAAAA